MPRLPLASPAALCAGVPALAAPLLDEAALAVTLAELSRFADKGGDAEKLHQALLAYRDALPGNASWLRPFWNDMYLQWRGPLPLNLNYCFSLEGGHWGPGGVEEFVLRIARTAVLLGAGELEAERSRSGYMAMDQARTAFYTRVPAPAVDRLLPAPLDASPQITVLCRGCAFIVPLYDENNRPPSVSALRKTLAAVRLEAEQAAGSGGPPCPVGAMTAAPREQAAAIRTALAASPKNRLSLAALERSLLVLCLDPGENSDEDLARRLLAGPAENRWFDKSLQIIATEKGSFGINLEHAGCDAGIWAWLLDKAASLPGEDDAPQAGSLPFRRLEWEAAKKLEAELAAGADDFKKRGEAVDISQKAFPELSRERLKAMRTSPDAFLQVALQLAQYSVFGEMRSSYEAVSMRGYAEGRTECARGNTQAAAALARALERGENDTKLRELYRTAERAHLGRLVACQRGQAVERYVSGLEAMFRLRGKELGISAAPGFFSDPGWKKIKHDSLSTSGMATEGIHAFTFAPVVNDGFGIGYVPGKNRTVLTVACFFESGLEAAGFTRAFTHSTNRIAGLLQGG